MKNAVKIAIAVVCLLAAAFITFRHISGAAAEPDTDGSLTMECGSGECGAVFRVTLKEFKEARLRSPDGLVKCPKCGSAKTRMIYQCPSCQKTMEPQGHGVRPRTCPHCGAPQPTALGG